MKAPPDTHAPGHEGALQGGGDIDLDRLFPPLATGVHWGLERTEEVLRALGDPHRSFHVLHVGGTNGKGSLAAVWARILHHAGRRVGLYTSPHLCSFRERFQIGGRPAAAEKLHAAADDLRGPMSRVGLTFFEAATALAFHLFREESVDVAVVEVGLGGRLDSTNVVVPKLTAITNVAMDHADYLGGTLTSIAREKAGIIKPRVPVMTAETDPHILSLFRSRARDVAAPFHLLDPSDVIHELEVAPRGNAFTLETGEWGTLPLLSPLPGRHQAANVALAIRSLELLGDDLRPSREETVVEGVADVSWPGRLQIVTRPEGVWVFDVAHNTAAVHALGHSFPVLHLPRPHVLLVGIQGDKDWRAMLPPLFAMTREAVLTQPPTVPPERRWNPLEAAGAVEDRPNLHIVPDFPEAMRVAREAAGAGTVLVTGSHHTVGDGMNVLGIRPYGEGGDGASA